MVRGVIKSHVEWDILEAIDDVIREISKADAFILILNFFCIDMFIN